MPEAIISRNLTKRFGGRPVVEGVNLAVPTGSVYGFLGQNGAGKTTVIRLVLGLLRPTLGEVHVLGEPVATCRRRVAAKIGALVETPALYDHLTGAENLDLTRRLLGLRKSEIERVLEIIDLRHAAGTRVGSYSLGMRQRLGIARALLGEPRLLVLDEPTNGLDPDGICDVRDLIRSLARERDVTIIVSSHLLSEVEQIATDVGVMHGGRLVAQTSLADLRAGTDRELEIDVDDPERLAALLWSAGLPAWVVAHGELRLRLPSDSLWTPEAISRGIVEAGFAIRRFVERMPTLEDLYLGVTDRAAERIGHPQAA